MRHNSGRHVAKWLKMRESDVKWIAGLGNPGDKYRNNRHNAGFMAIDRFAAKHGIAVTKNKFKALYGEGYVGTCKVALLKPMTYMNLSGEAVRAFLDWTKADIADGIVLYDDLDTELGRIRLRYKGGPGGHNGVKSLIAHLGTESFNRIRIGISRPAPGEDIVRYVLQDFAKSEADALDRALSLTVEALEAALAEPFDRVMAKFN